MSTNTPNNEIPRLVNTKEAAQILGVSKATLDRDRATGCAGGVPCIRIGGRALYSPEQILEWAKARAIVPTPALAPQIEAAPLARRRGRPRKTG
ncbi:MAG: helix-turn-helix transcriptional regulator [Acidobacteriaceae bacterium]